MTGAFLNLAGTITTVRSLVPDPRRRRGRRYLLAFVLAVAVACVLAGAKSFREIGDQAADLPQEVLSRLGGRPHPLLRRIIAPSETRIRTLAHSIGAGILDEIIGGWLRGVADGQVKLFAAMLHARLLHYGDHRRAAEQRRCPGGHGHPQRPNALTAGSP